MFTYAESDVSINYEISSEEARIVLLKGKNLKCGREGRADFVDFVVFVKSSIWLLAASNAVSDLKDCN